MAKDKGKGEDLEADEEEAVKAPKKKSGVLKWVLIGLGVFSLIIASVGTSIYLVNTMLRDKMSAQDSGAANANDKAAKDDKAKDDKSGKSKQHKVPTYYKFDPPFVVNFMGGASARYLQLTIEVMTYDPTVVQALEQHMPLIRNNVVFLLSGLTSEQISSVEGKQKIRADTLATIQGVLKEQTGKPGIEDVYFTSFVMQ